MFPGFTSTSSTQTARVSGRHSDFLNVDGSFSLLNYVAASYQTKKSGAGVLIHCPFHADKHESMYVTEDYAYCFACGRGWNAKQFLSSLGINVDAPTNVSHKPKQRSYRPPKSYIVEQAHDILMKNKPKLRYLTQDRALLMSVIKEYQVGYFRPPLKKCKMPRYTFPAWGIDNNLVSISYRHDPSITYGDNHIDDKRYITHPGSQVSLYNLHKVPSYDWMVYVGGQIDALSLLQFGIPTVGAVGEGIFHNEWADFIGDKTVYVLLDNDDAGKLGAIKVARSLHDATVVEWPEGMPKKYDVNSAIKDPVFGLKGLTALLRSYGARL